MDKLSVSTLPEVVLIFTEQFLEDRLLLWSRLKNMIVLVAEEVSLVFLYLNSFRFNSVPQAGVTLSLKLLNKFDRINRESFIK